MDLGLPDAAIAAIAVQAKLRPGSSSTWDRPDQDGRSYAAESARWAPDSTPASVTYDGYPQAPIVSCPACGDHG
jgi:hypothetical protein